MAGNFSGGSFSGEIGGFSVDSVGPPFTGGGALWAKGRGKLNLKRRRPLTFAENEELRERLQAIAAQKEVSIPMSIVGDTKAFVMADDDDDLLLEALILRVLH